LPIFYRMDAARRRVYSTLEGSVELHEMTGMIDAVVSDPLFVPGFTVLSDHRRVARPISSAQLHAFLGHLAATERLAGTRWSVVTVQAASYAMMQLMRSLIPLYARLEIAVFTTVADAEAWLDRNVHPQVLGPA
jgi:hypothetical protein